MQAIVLAGGLGTRLREATGDIPKPMAPIAGRPFLEYCLRYLELQGVTSAVLAVGYRREVIRAFAGERFGGMRISYSAEDSPLGTGGALRKALGACSEEDVVVVNGDTFFAAELPAMFRAHREGGWDILLALKPMEQCGRYGAVELRGGRVVRFLEKQPPGRGIINGGVYIARRDLFDFADFPEKFSFERDFLERYTGEKRMGGYLCEGAFIDIGIPEDYRRAQEMLPGLVAL